MNNKIQETLDILQEECAEVIVEISKCRRFGFDSIHYRTQILHREMLLNEIGDVLAMVDILIDQGLVDKVSLDKAKQNKKEKLKTWSNIFKENANAN
jgi:NTP pyrophosphatase (non-canonical NTP hydrolase)